VTVTAIEQLQLVAAVVNHVLGVTAKVDLADGSRVTVADPPMDGSVGVEPFRSAVIEADRNDDVRPVVAALGACTAPVSASLVAAPAIRALDRGTRWQHVSGGRTTDYIVVRLDLEDALELAGATLGAAGLERCVAFRARPDPELGITVLVCERPSRSRPAEDARIDRALRDLVVMDRVRARIRVP
jgi:hypothetical protein